MFRIRSRAVLATILFSIMTLKASAQLNELAKNTGKLYFGTETETWEFNDTEYFSILTDTREFGQLVPGNSMKVSRTWLLADAREQDDSLIVDSLSGRLSNRDGISGISASQIRLPIWRGTTGSTCAATILYGTNNCPDGVSINRCSGFNFSKERKG